MNNSNYTNLEVEEFSIKNKITEKINIISQKNKFIESKVIKIKYKKYFEA